jgi:hypothetical protein
LRVVGPNVTGPQPFRNKPTEFLPTERGRLARRRPAAEPGSGGGAQDVLGEALDLVLRGELGSRSAPLRLGTEIQRGADWRVAVLSFDADANAEIAAANQFNEPPPEGERYVLVRLRATYSGGEEGNAGFQLNVGYIGSDNRIYEETDCGSVEPDAISEQPEVVEGGTVEGNQCLLLPVAVIGTGAIFVEPGMSFDDIQAWWSET